MARVSGPFLSIDASGKFGSVMVASIWKGRNYMRMHFIPADLNSTDQQAQREIFSAAILAWQALGGTYQEEWNVAARDVYPPISGFNYFMKVSCAEGATPPAVIPDVAPKTSKVLHNR